MFIIARYKRCIAIVVGCEYVFVVDHLGWLKRY